MATTDAPEFFSVSGDLALGILHVSLGVIAILGNAVVFYVFFKHAAQRASACLFVQLACTGILVSYASIYSGIYLLRSRRIPETDTALYSLGLSIGHIWWFGYLCTIMLVTTLSAVRAWSIARPFTYKMQASRTSTVALSVVSWSYPSTWIAARYIVSCRWVLQSFFSYAHVYCPGGDGVFLKGVTFVLDVLPILVGFLVTVTSNLYVIAELAKSLRNPPNTITTRETFSKTTRLIVAMTTLFLMCYTPTLIFFFIHSFESITENRYSDVFGSLEPKGFIYLFAFFYFCPSLYPALSPLLQFWGARQERRNLSVKTHNMMRMITRNSLGTRVSGADLNGRQMRTIRNSATQLDSLPSPKGFQRSCTQPTNLSVA